MTQWVEEDFLGGFQTFLVKIEGVSNFAGLRGGGGSDLFGNDKP